MQNKGWHFRLEQLVRLAVLLSFFLAVGTIADGQALTDDPAIINDHIFPAQTVAKPYSDFDAKGFLINGKRTFLVSAGMEYARVPHQLWYNRLLRLKRGGFNCVEIYTIWNFHEPREGKFEFSGDQDLDLFLSMVKKMGLYAIVRVGPYYCAEWDQGGYPLWLRFKDGLRVREDNEVFENYADRYFDHLLPIVFKHQINKGGAVILVQLENEHPKGWGTITPDGYFKHLQNKSLSLGLQVPYFFSGLHHSSDPAGEGMLDNAARPNPWLSTEFWSTWYTQYGPKPSDASTYERRTWKIIAHGGNGYNFYMAHGGSNFGYTNNDEDAASYDYGAAVGQAGDLRPMYYTFKRAGFFAQSFAAILENSSDAGRAYETLATDTAVKISGRTSKDGDLIFLDHPGRTKPVSITIKVNPDIPAVKIMLAPGEIYPIVRHFQINSEVMLNWALTRIYGIVKQKQNTTIIIEAEKGQTVFLQFLVAGKMKTIDGTAGLMPAEQSFSTAKGSVRLLIMDQKAADHTWMTDKPELNAIVTGVSYLGKIAVKSGKLIMVAEYPLNGHPDQSAKVYLENGSQKLQGSIPAAPVKTPFIKLAAWQFKDATRAAAVNYNDSHWLGSDRPLQMGADGDLTAEAWYRVKFAVPAAGKYTLQVDGGDRGTAFIDGKAAARWKIKTGEVSVDLQKGAHTLAVFTAHDGRDKMAAYLGPIENLDKKGLTGNAVLKIGGQFISTLDHWYISHAKTVAAVKNGPPILDTLTAEKYKIGEDAFNLKEGYGWFQTIIPAHPDLSKLVVSFKSVDENATVFINGKQVLYKEGWNNPFEFTIADAAIIKKPIQLAVFIENYSKEGGIDQPVKINAIGDGQLLTNWKMRGGPDLENAEFKIVSTDIPNGPRFFRSFFTLPEPKGTHFIWRVDTKGLSYGSVWVNGHHLGRYPEKNGPIGLYIPEPWLKSGENELLIYDEEGKNPAGVAISSEAAAGRVSYQLKSK